MALSEPCCCLASFGHSPARASCVPPLCTCVPAQNCLFTFAVARCQQGDEQVEVEDWDTQELLVLPLDSTKPPVATAEGLYKRARKQRRAVDHVEPLLKVPDPPKCNRCQ